MPEKRVGWFFHVSHPTFFGHGFPLTDQDIKKRYTNVDILIPSAFSFVAKVVGLVKEWHHALPHIRFSFAAKHMPWRFDAVAGAVKDMHLLQQFSKKRVPNFFLGYQHFPVLGGIDGQ